MVLLNLSKKVIVWCVSVVMPALVLLAGCSKSGSESADIKKVRVGITKSFLGEAATFVAKEQGFFRANGLDVQLKRNTSGAVSVRELFDGKVDIAHVAETPVVYSLVDTAYYKNLEVPSFQIFADMIYSDDIQRVVGRKDHGIAKPRDIAGKKVALYRDTQLDYFLDSFLLECQITRDSLTLVDMEPEDQVKAIINGEIDVAVTWEPYATYIKRQLEDETIFLDTKLTYSSLWMATTLDDYAEENPDVLTNYLRAIRQAQRYITKNTDEARKLLADRTGVSLQVITDTWDDIDYELSLSERMVTLLDDQERWLMRNNRADTAGIDYRSIINFEPMREVYPQGISVIQ